MANEEHLAILQQGVEAWNQWRKDKPALRPDLRRSDLREADIQRTDLSGADLRGANIEGVDFYLVDLRGAKYDADQAQQLRKCGAILKEPVV